MINRDERLKVGLATFAQPTFDVEWARQTYDKTRALLEELGLDVVSFDGPLMYEQEAYDFRRTLRQANVDAVFLQSGGFSFGGLAVILASGLDVPTIVWATPEPAWDGGVIRSNSLCAGIMNNSSLKKAGLRPQFFMGYPEGDTQDRLQPLLAALRVVKSLKTAKIGVIGHRAPGFYSSTYDELKLQTELGVQTFHIDISSVLQAVDGISDDAAEAVLAELPAAIHDEVEQKRPNLLRSVKVFLALDSLAGEQGLDAMAIKCWPEFPVEQDFSVCLAVSLLNNAGRIMACEADVYGAVTMLIQDLLTGGPEFFNDLIQIDPESNQALYWHCGAAPLAMLAAGEEASIEPHGMRRKAAAILFPLKTGAVTVARLSEDGSGDGWRMLAATGTAVETERLLKGNPSQVVMDMPVQTLLDTILDEGFEHHYSSVYGSILPELTWICRLLGIRLVNPQ